MAKKGGNAIAQSSQVDPPKNRGYERRCGPRNDGPRPDTKSLWAKQLFFCTRPNVLVVTMK